MLQKIEDTFSESLSDSEAKEIANVLCSGSLEPRNRLSQRGMEPTHFSLPTRTLDKVPKRYSTLLMLIAREDLVEKIFAITILLAA
jgi:hypothetical protein